MDQVVEVKGVKLLAVSVDGVDMNGLRDLGDQLKGKLGEGVIVLASASDGKVNLVAMATDDAMAHGAISSRALRVKSAEAVVDVRTWRRQAVRIRQAFRMPLPRRKRHLRHSLHKNSTEIHDCVYL